MEYNDLLLEYRVTKMFKQEAVFLGLSQAAYLLTERENALYDSLKKIDKNFVG